MTSSWWCIVCYDDILWMIDGDVDGAYYMGILYFFFYSHGHAVISGFNYQLHPIAWYHHMIIHTRLKFNTDLIKPPLKSGLGWVTTSIDLYGCNNLHINSLRPRRNRSYNADDIFKCIFLKENVWTLTKISLKFVPKSPIDNVPALVQIMAWRRPGDKSSSEPMMVRLLTHICVTRPQRVKAMMA